VAIALLVLPAAASATPRHVVRPGGFEARLHLRGSHGYELTVAAETHRQITLTATKGPATDTYTVAGHASRQGIDADFGSLGRISVRFEASPRRRRAPHPANPACRGRRPIDRHGTFRGTIRFEGEEGFTAVGAHRAPGSSSRTFRRICRLRGSKLDVGLLRRARALGPRQPLLSLLLAASKEAGVETELAILGLEPAAGSSRPETFTIIIGGRRERLGRVGIQRTLFTEGDAGSYLLSAPGVSPIEATVTPPSPFFGSATFHQDAGSPALWSGTLGASFAGAASVPLTGAGFKAGFCRSPRFDVFERCLEGLEQTIAG
jgi:hypothetical protein